MKRNVRKKNYPKYPECSNLKKNKKRQIVWNKLLRFLFIYLFIIYLIYIYIIFKKKKKKRKKINILFLFLLLY